MSAGVGVEARVQPGIAALKAYDPGHDIVALRERFGADVLVELGGNESPYGCSPLARAALEAALGGLCRYPDPTAAALRRAIAAREGLAPDQVLPGNGSHELLMQLAQAYAGPGSAVLVPRYGFAVHSLAAIAAGATLRVADALPVDAPMPRGHDLDALAAAIGTDTALVYLSNPNNPTGTWFPTAALEAFLGRVPADVVVVVDEAYHETVTTAELPSARGLLDRFPNLVVTRTFSKAYGLAGLRVGYALADAALLAPLERLRESFAVNALALAAAEAALRDQGHVDRFRALNRAQRDRLSEGLQELGWTVSPSQTNFLLADLGRDAAPVEQALVDRGLVVRPMGGYGLPDCLRISVGDARENARLLAVLEAIQA